TVATGALTEATNLSVGVVDEDGSQLSRQIAEGLVRPTFQPAVQIKASDIDAKMDRGELLFVVEIPPNFQANVVAQRQTEIQINVDATAVAQAGNGATYLKRNFQRNATLPECAASPAARRSILSCAPISIPT